MSIGALVLVALLAGGVGAYLYTTKTAIFGAPLSPASSTNNATSTVTTNPIVDAQISQAYSTFEDQQDLTPGNQYFITALQSLRDIAANENNTALERVEALNGINYAYTQSNFDAADLYTVVFSQPPFNAYYIPATSTTKDVIHPTSGPNVPAIEAGLLKINQLSNSLIPNHYAISRMEVAAIFAFQRAVAANPTQKPQLQQQYTTQLKSLVAAFNSLTPLASITGYTFPMRLQIMFAHASALAFVGRALNDSAYLDQGETEFAQTISLGSAYSPAGVNANLVANQTLLARVFYASYYWKIYQKSDPQKIEDVLQPITDTAAIQNTNFYQVYLPSNKNTKVSPFTELRNIAAKDAALKTFLEGRGWVF